MIGTKLAEYELKELTARGGPSYFEKVYDPETEERDQADRVGGLGAHA